MMKLTAFIFGVALASAFAFPIGANAQVLNQNQITTGPYGGIPISTSTTPSGKLNQILGSAYGDILYWTGTRWNVIATSSLGITSGTTYAFTYPLQNIANVISLAFGTSTSNIWGGTQTFTNAPILSSLTGLLKGNGSSAVSVATAGTDYIVPATAFTTGSIPFANSSGQLAQDNTGLFYDNGNKRVGIGTNAPSQSLSIAAPNSNNWAQLDRTNTTYESAFQWTTGGTPSFFLGLRNVSPATGLHMYDYALGRDVMILNAAGDIEWNQGANFVIDNLAGSGTRMVVASALGALSTQTIPSGGGSGVPTSSPIASSNLLTYSTAGAGSAYGTATTSATCAGTVSCSPFVVIGGTPITLTGSASATGLGTSSPWTGSGVAYRVSDSAVSTAATGTVSNGTGISVTAGQSIIGSGLTITNTGVTSLAATYPLQTTAATGALTISTAFGTSTSNTWGGTQTFTSPIVDGTLSGTINANNGTTYATATSTPTVTAPIAYSGTLGSFIGGVSGAFSCVVATGSVAGCLSATDWLSFNNKISSTSLSAVSPLRYVSSTGVFSWLGLATTSQPASSNILVSDGAAGVYGSATSSIAVNASLSSSGTLFAQVGGTASTIGLNLSNPNSWSALQTFANSSTTLASFSYASSTLGVFGTLTIPSLGTAAGTFLAVDPTGKVIATTTPSGGAGTNYFTLTGAQLQNNTGTSLGINAAPNLGTFEVQASSSTAAPFAFWNSLGAALLYDSPTGHLTVGSTTNNNGGLNLIDTNSSLGVGLDSIVLGGNPGGDTDFWFGRNVANDSVNNDRLQWGLGLVPGTTPKMTLDFNGNLGVGTTTPVSTVDVSGFINTDRYSGYRQDGRLLAYASTTNQSTIFGIGAGGQNATTSATAGNTTAVGYLALTSLTSGLRNTAVGEEAVASTTSGSDNTGIGYNAIWHYTGGSNTAIGSNAMGGVGSGGSNVAIGASALGGSDTGAGNVAIGASSLIANTSGTLNTGIGANALGANTSGFSNTGVGNAALQQVTGNQNVAIGNSAGTGVGAYVATGSTYIGNSAGASVATGSSFNTSIGYDAGFNMTSGYENTLIGSDPSFVGNITTGGGNIGIGSRILFPSVSTNRFLNIGGFIFGNLPATTSASVIATPATGMLGIGTTSPSGAILTLSTTTAKALRITNGSATAIQWIQGVQNDGSFVFSTSTAATPFATSTLPALQLNPNATGISVGSSTPWRTITFAGTGAWSGLTASASGQAGDLCLSSTNEVINASVACIVSSGRYKQDIHPLGESLSEVLKLTPVSFKYKPDFNGELQSNANYSGEQVGFIAEDVEKIDPRLVVVETGTTTFEGKTYPAGTPHSVRYEQMTALLAGAIQDQQKEIDSLKGGVFKAARSAEENWQWFAIVVLLLWNLVLTIAARRRK